jgi:hypothetical protein
MDQKPATRLGRRFAPLNPQRAEHSGARKLKGIVFDVDGTLWYVFLKVEQVLSGKKVWMYDEIWRWL